MAFVLLVAEGVARVAFAPPRYHNEPLRLDATLGFAGIPGYSRRQKDAEGSLYAFALNVDGFRGPVLPETGDPPSDRARIALLGDSFLVGQGVPEEALLSRRLERALGARGQESEVYNLSAADYGTGQQLLLFDSVRERLAPDHVVLALYPGNDVVNNFEGLAGRTAVSPGDPLRPYVVPGSGDATAVHFVQPLRHRLRHVSRLFAVLEHRLVAYAVVGGIGVLQPFGAVASPEARIASGELGYERLELFREHPPDHVWEQAWQRTFALLRALRSRCDAQGARLHVLVIPALHQVRRAAGAIQLDLLQRAHDGTRFDERLDWNLPERRIAAFLREEGIGTTLLLDALRGSARRGERPYLHDHHLSAAGHAIAAESLAASLDAGAKPAGARPGGAPIRLPRGADAPARIELGGARHELYRDRNWLPWTSSEGEHAEGALPLDGAFVAVPLRPGARELVVRGIAAAPRYPLEVEIAFEGGPAQRLRVAKPGPFVLHLAAPVARLPRSDGHVGLRFRAADASADPTSTGIIVRDVGFAEAL